MRIKKILKKLFDPIHFDSDCFVKYLRQCGVEVGEGTYFFNPKTTQVDVQYAPFIKIGKYCKITKNVTILSHDYSYSVLREVYHDIPRKAGMTIIGNNVFIGINSIILMGSHVGNNVIIGAGSVVSGTIPDNEVWGGNPAKFICTLDDYHKKCKLKFENNASLFIHEYQNKWHRNPTITELETFSLLFINNDKNYDALEELSKIKFSGDNKKDAIKDCLNYKSKYKSYDDFLEYIDKERKNEKN